MPQTLADVLHFFLPELGASNEAVREDDALALRRRDGAWPVVSVPLGDHDVVRAAFVWNLAVEIARTGAGANVLATGGAAGAALWPSAGRGPLGAELTLTATDDPGELAAAAATLAAQRAREASAETGIVFVHLPVGWLAKPADAAPLLERVLLFATPDPQDLLDAYAVAKRVVTAAPLAHIGVTIHGARGLEEARGAFERLASESERQLDRSLSSFGLIAGDLDVYRSILHRRAVGLDYPHGIAARSMADVAHLLIGDWLAGDRDD